MTCNQLKKSLTWRKTMNNRALSAKQQNIIDVIKKGNSDGSWCDLDQILDNIDYTTTKESIQFSLRFLANRGYIAKLGQEKRRGKMRVVYQPMSAAFSN